MNSVVIPMDVRKKAKYCFECGACTASCPMTELLSPSYNPRSLLNQILSDPEKALMEKNIWLCAWCYRCCRRCPQGLKLPEIFQLVKIEATKRGIFDGFEQAMETIKEKIPFPLICSYTCFHPERAGPNDRKTAEALQKLKDKPSQALRGEAIIPKQKIAIIGSGPAGLAAAGDLVELGYFTSVFEVLPALGGMLRKSMPGYRLPKKELEREIRFLEKSGIDARTNTKVGKDIEFNDLWHEGYEAVFVAIGAHKSRKLRIKGENLKGVVDALDFLWKVNMKQKIKLGSKVGVIGGGNVAVDAARTALRHGSQQVSILYRRSKEEMPANPWEITEAEKEGVTIKLLVSPREIKRKGKKLELTCAKMELGEADETGRRTPHPIEGSEILHKFDTIIVAIGESPDTSFLPKKVKVDNRGKILINPFTMETSMKGVFAGGDVVTGPASVMEAIVAGKRAACTITKYLKTKAHKENNNGH